MTKCEDKQVAKRRRREHVSVERMILRRRMQRRQKEHFRSGLNGACSADAAELERAPLNRFNGAVCV